MEEVAKEGDAVEKGYLHAAQLSVVRRRVSAHLWVNRLRRDKDVVLDAGPAGNLFDGNVHIAPRDDLVLHLVSGDDVAVREQSDLDVAHRAGLAVRGVVRVQSQDFL